MTNVHRASGRWTRNLEQKIPKTQGGQPAIQKPHSALCLVVGGFLSERGCCDSICNGIEDLEDCSLKPKAKTLFLRSIELQQKS